MKTNKEKTHMRSFLLVTILTAALPAIAQPLYQVTPARTYGAKDTTKQERVFPIFWSAARKVFPPLPFNPFPELTVYDAGNHNLIYDDREVDYPALEAAMEKERAQAEAEAAALEEEAGGGGMAMRSSSSSTNLTLATPVFDGTNLALVIENGVAGEFYDLFYSTNLVDWHFYVRTDLDQFSFSITPPAWPVCFLRLGTQQDTDDDTLTDAYEALITQTSPTYGNTLQNVNNNPNLTAYQIQQLTMVLTDQPPVLQMGLYESDESDVFLNSPCAFVPGSPFGSTINHTRWTNGQGGFFTRSRVWSYCVNNSDVSTNYQREGRIPTNNFGLGEFRDRIDNGAWSNWTPDFYNFVPEPFALQVDTSYRQIVYVRTNGTTPLETYGVTNTTRTTMHYLTRGLPFDTTTLRRHKITVSAIDYGTPGGTNVPRQLIRFPLLPYQPYADSNGVLYVTLRDNMTNYVTPELPPQFTNYTYDISPERHLIPLNFRSLDNEFLTGPDENFDGYDGQKYLNWALVLATNLGVHATPDDGTLGGIGTNIVNAEEISAIVPTIPAVPSGFWRWHQEKQLKRYLWTNGATTVRILGDVSFSTLGPDGGNDTPTPSPGANPAWDSVPDTFGRVYFPDAPSLRISDPDLLNAPLNSIAALRFYGHTWLTGDGAFASPVLKWRTFITIKKTTNGWVRVGQNFIQETPSGVSEDPVFPISEPSGL